MRDRSERADIEARAFGYGIWLSRVHFEHSHLLLGACSLQEGFSRCPALFCHAHARELLSRGFPKTVN